MRFNCCVRMDFRKVGSYNVSYFVLAKSWKLSPWAVQCIVNRLLLTTNTSIGEEFEWQVVAQTYGISKVTFMKPEVVKAVSQACAQHIVVKKGANKCG